MRSYLVTGFTIENQLELYKGHKDFSVNHPIIGRLLAVPVAFLDVSVSVFIIPISVIEHLALVAINLFGSTISTECTVKDALDNFEVACLETITYPVKVLFMPIKFLFQVCVIIIDPAEYLPAVDGLAAFKGENIVMFQHTTRIDCRIFQPWDYREV